MGDLFTEVEPNLYTIRGAFGKSHNNPGERIPV
jgi:hypothetical protein